MTAAAERPPWGARQRKPWPFIVHFSMSPFSSDRPSRCGPRASGQSPSATLWGPWAEVSALKRSTRGPTTSSRFSMGFTRLRHLTPRCFASPVGRTVGQPWNFGPFPSFRLGIMMPMRVSVFLLGLAISTSAAAQSPQPTRVTLPTVTVTAQKEPADPQDLPVSLSIVPLDAVWNGGMTTIGEASIYAPNTYFTDFTARKLSNPRFRGIGASPANPSITTFIDGVPQ